MNLLFPSGIIFFLIVIGLIILWFTKKQNLGKLSVTLGMGLLFLLSNFFVSNFFIQTLENQYPPYHLRGADRKEFFKKDSVKFIVVLGAGQIANSDWPCTSQLSSSSLIRLAEGIQLYRHIKGTQLVLSGGKVFDNVSIAETLKKVALELGMPEQDLILEQMSQDTKDQARYVKLIVEKTPFILVTAASHMPRAMAIFEKQGMAPIPAPTGFLSRRRHHIKINAYSEFLSNLSKSETAFYEYVSYIWAKFKNQL